MEKLKGGMGRGVGGQGGWAVGGERGIPCLVVAQLIESHSSVRGIETAAQLWRGGTLYVCFFENIHFSF